MANAQLFHFYLRMLLAIAIFLSLATYGLSSSCFETISSCARTNHEANFPVVLFIETLQCQTKKKHDCIPTNQSQYSSCTKAVEKNKGTGGCEVHKRVEILRDSQTFLKISRGGFLPSGYHPLGYALTELGKQFLQYDGSIESDVGRFLASLKSGRKTKSTLKAQWLEVLRVSKTGQSLRIYRILDDLITFSLKAGFIR